MVLGRFQIRPPPYVDVAIRSHSKVGPMNMLMSSVGMDRVTRMKTPGNFAAVLLKAIDRNDAGDCFNPGCREVNLIAQPRRRNDTVCVGVGEPNVG
jgi:hypothetical protein